MAMIAIARDNAVFVRQRRLDASGNCFLPDIKVAKAAN